MKKFLKILFPILYLLVGIGGLASWELYFKDKINTEQVLVATKNINFKDKLTSQNTKLIEVKRDNVVSGAITKADVPYVLNKNASINIHKGTQIYSDLVDQYNLIPNEKKGEFIAPIPKEWLYAVPGSLRRTYVADFYAIPTEQQAQINSLVQESKDKKDKDEPIKTNDEVDSVVTKDNQPIVKNVRVASVKDDSNKEVTESKDDKSSATGVVSNLEIISNKKMFAKIKDYTDQGYKIYVVYKFDR